MNSHRHAHTYIKCKIKKTLPILELALKKEIFIPHKTNINVLLLTYRATEKVEKNVESYLYNHVNIFCNAYYTDL